jgi:peptidoglycan/LPS O-acetylase OafA/YrhL
MRREISIYLDALRIIAAFTVFFEHTNSVTKIFWRINGHAQEAVITFFVLSGFVIAFVADKQENSAPSYFIARAARIYSVAILAIPVTLIADAIGSHFQPSSYYGHGNVNLAPGLSDLLSYLTFTNEIWYRHVLVGSDEPFWSLGFEVWYYVIFGVVAFSKGPSGKLAAGAVLIFVGPKIALYYPIWLIGLFLYKVIGKHGDAVARRVPKPVGLVLFLAAPVVYFLLHGDHGTIFQPYAPIATMIVNWLYYVTVALLLSVHLIGFSIIAPSLTPLLNFCAPTIRWCAGATFTLYLVHQPIVFCLATLSPWPIPSIARALFIVTGAIALVYLLAELGERRKTIWRRQFERLVRWLHPMIFGRT